MPSVDVPHDSVGEAAEVTGMILQAEPEKFLFDSVTPSQVAWSAAGFVAAVTVVLSSPVK